MPFCNERHQFGRGRGRRHHFIDTEADEVLASHPTAVVVQPEDVNTKLLSRGYFRSRKGTHDVVDHE